MLFKINKTDLIATDAVIKKLADKHGILDERVKLMRAMWNIMTNNNKERKRGREILGKFLNKETK